MREAGAKVRTCGDLVRQQAARVANRGARQQAAGARGEREETCGDGSGGTGYGYFAPGPTNLLVGVRISHGYRCDYLDAGTLVG